MATDIYHTNLVTAVSLSTTSETAVIVSTPVADGTSRCIISGHVNIFTGTGTTGITLRLRQGAGIGGTIIGVSETTAAGAGVNQTFYISFEDILSPLNTAAGGQYTLSVIQNGATGNGSCNSGDLLIQVPN